MRLSLRRIVLSAAVALFAIVGCSRPSVPADALNADGTLRLSEHEVSLSPDSFDQVFAGDLPVLVDFSAGWCQPCLEAQPEVKAIAEKRRDLLRVAIADMTAMANAPAARYAIEWEVEGFPAFLLFDPEGNEIVRSEGLPIEPLADWIDAGLARIAE